MSEESTKKGYQFNTFAGVYVPSILTILGVVLFMRVGDVIAQAGILGTLGILFLAESIAIATALAVSAISTNTPISSGGSYFLISRALGPGFGSSLGLTYFVSLTLAVPFYTIGFSDAIIMAFPILKDYFLLISLLPLTLLFIIAFVSANLAIKTQYIIMATLFLAIVAFMGGAAVNNPNMVTFTQNWQPANVENFNILIFAACFAVFFPAVTGFDAGVNMSGDLKDPQKSIPKGILLAIFTGFAIYLVEILLIGGAFSRDQLNDSYKTLQTHAIFNTGFLVLAGVSASTLSSAMGTLMGGPRVLQALASDKIIKPLNFFAKGRGETNDPVAATILTYIISVAIIIYANYLKSSEGANPLNIVATLVTMFTLCTYAIINLAAFVESFAANPSFRPHFRLFHWSIGLYGFVASAIIAFIIAPGTFVLALFILILIFFFTSKLNIKRSFSDARRGFYFAQIRQYLLKLEKMISDSKNWRPQILVLANKNEKHQTLIKVANLLNNDRGLVSVARVLPFNENEYETCEQQRIAELKEMKESFLQDKLDAFPYCVVSNENFDTVLNIFLQSFSASPIAFNVALSGWPENIERVDSYFKHILTIKRLYKSCLLLLNGHKLNLKNPTGPIDIYWRGRHNGSLMLLLAYLITCNKYWEKIQIRLIRVATNENLLQAKEELSLLIKEARIEAKAIVLSADFPFDTILKSTSSNSSLIFMGFLPPTEDDFMGFYYDRTKQLEDLPPTFLVSSAGDSSLSS